MKKSLFLTRLHSFFLFLLCFALLVCFSAYAESMDEFLIGNWAFPHDLQKTILSLREDGTATYGSSNYNWECTESALILTGADGSSAALHMEINDEGITLYLPSMFERTSDTEGIVGSWEAVGSSQSSFIFTDDGRFLEDGVFTGNYDLNEESGQITLLYGKLFQDTTVDYSFVDDYLCIAYPWKMVRQ